MHRSTDSRTLLVSRDGWIISCWVRHPAPHPVPLPPGTTPGPAAWQPILACCRLRCCPLLPLSQRWRVLLLPGFKPLIPAAQRRCCRRLVAAPTASPQHRGSNQRRHCGHGQAQPCGAAPAAQRGLCRSRAQQGREGAHLRRARLCGGLHPEDGQEGVARLAVDHAPPAAKPGHHHEALRGAQRDARGRLCRGRGAGGAGGAGVRAIGARGLGRGVPHSSHA